MSHAALTSEQARWAAETLDKLRGKMAWVSDKNREKIPYTTLPDGSYDNKLNPTHGWSHDDGPNWWTNGFWSGLMWLLYQDTGEPGYLHKARFAESHLEHCMETFYGLHHDVGFMFRLTSAVDFDLTENRRAYHTAMHAASLLMGRFNPAGNFLRAWNDLPGHDTRGWVIIDSMFNLSLLYWAWEHSSDPRYKNVAVAHADTVRRAFVREDGSVCHVVEFDPETGRRLCSHAGQGYGHGSSWTRGQAWALYGFVISYLHTNKAEYLETARKVADYCLRCMPENGIIPVDFRQPPQPAWEDSCAACILASGLIELSRQLPEETGAVYLRSALHLLQSLCPSRTDWTRQCDAIVQNCSASYHDIRHHFPMSYADFFFAEALYKLNGMEKTFW
ncbi:glycoside hydrolase family 88 protein [Ruthenibacterium lactatiformans]|uniref:glycoside hydrolase family 88 protein n=1 Tax=Ruthenibacterium lactatiformans TaxID=1550024 RepID=UPI0026DC5B9E|nr:glycoside hydrolase family 88 protein [Ruthenibacterium lactatiformans]